ncbi:hypothetical protein LXM94_15695 [Rhizobium sp. TRM95111]|uniref:hypothetical protein n=1 Tax=Rhizobium alarense TaxID=2846851 RepID=UPI001F4881C6|nr:hypothetical protein [Rhizobium alarense]MCF3641417.1 hypothetical protein [Rhizobium alarense]
MANGLFSARNGKGRRFFREEEQTLEDQLAQLRDDVASLAKLVARDASHGVDGARRKMRGARHRAEEVKEHAESDIRDLISAGEEVLADFRNRYRGTGREVRRTVRQHPVAALGAMAAAGFVLAALLRR